MPSQHDAAIIDSTWLARISFDPRLDRPSSTWLPPGQRLVGRLFNDPSAPSRRAALGQP